jgi:hypothetical protein
VRWFERGKQHHDFQMDLHDLNRDLHLGRRL